MVNYFSYIVSLSFFFPSLLVDFRSGKLFVFCCCRLQKHHQLQKQVTLLSLLLHGLMIFLCGYHQKHLAAVGSLPIVLTVLLMIRSLIKHYLFLYLQSQLQEGDGILK